MKHFEPDTDKNILTIYQGEDSYELTVHYTRGKLLRSRSHDSDAEYADDTVDSVQDAEGNELTDSEINALGLSDHDLMNLREHTIG